ncbi:MAG TPA: thiosulfate oxidation carrier protein SoxY [Burkholderiales bacterium]|nr:thiosulfate oxidation carrier protein SoxY [Burkholderiales bacterium]
MKRRTFLAGLGGLALAGAALAQESLDPRAAAVAKGAPVRKGKVKVTLPQLADNGNSVPIRIVVDSPMTATDYVKSIHLYSERNPVSNMANFYLGPRSGKAEIDSRVRLAGSQKVTAVAALSDGSFWYDAASIVVTLSACLDES